MALRVWAIKHTPSALRLATNDAKPNLFFNSIYFQIKYIVLECFKGQLNYLLKVNRQKIPFNERMQMV